MPELAPTTKREMPPPPKPRVRWVVTAFVLLFALALVVIASSMWILHAGPRR
jgi:heme/copper-type cytochrome/quinol oxidase subunit 4